MAARSPSPKSKQRYRLLDAYRGRGKGNNNLFLAYSVKTKQDFLLPSDRQFVHWIHYLETANNVKTFEIAPELVISHDSKETRGTELDAYVTNWDGSFEWHEVKSDEESVRKSNSQLIAQSSLSSVKGTPYRIFTDEDLLPHVESSIRWLKVIAYASTLRESPLIYQTTKILEFLESQQQGTLEQLIGKLKVDIPDVEIIKGLLARFSLTGYVSLDLSKFGFSPSSIWTWSSHA